MKEIRIGIIGTGVIAHGHVSRYQSIPGVKVVAACDIMPDKLEKFCDKYKIENRYADFRELLKRDDLDAVSVCVHNNLHTPLSVAVLRSGKACYCEKPLAGTYTDAFNIVNTAKETGRMLHVQLAFLYQGTTHAAKKLIADGRLGKIYHARSYGYRRRGRPFVDGYAEKEFNSKYWAAGGAMYDMGVYHISVLLYLMGLPKVERVVGQVYQEMDMHEARRKESGFDVDELGVGFVSFEKGLTMDILESWAIHAASFPPSMICGAEGGLSLVGDSALTFFTEASGYPMTCNVDVGLEMYRTRQADPSLALYDESQSHFVGALRGDCPLLPTPEIALQTMLVSEGVYMSGQLGREVTAQEITAKSVSQAIRTQEVPFGTIKYDF
ncbi:MAG: Gfo/Idh/MocA family oxidoreductase [Defluviitaleaceae bacterium]|nr:Gfo/Idh/MocA family oxidoreductase [Defluviitaleaceae bacterium]